MTRQDRRFPSMSEMAITAYTDTLPNGLTVVTVEAPHLYAIDISFAFKAGSRHEPSHLNGISHLLEHMIFRSKRSDSQAIYAAIESLGGTINGYTTRDTVCFNLLTNASNLHQTVTLFADMLFKYTDFDSIDLERDIIMAEILDDRDANGRLIEIDSLSRRLIFGKDHPMAAPIAGTRQTIGRISRQMLIDFKDRYLHPANAILVGTGPIQRKIFTELAQSEFNLPSKRKRVPPTPHTHPIPGPRSCLISHDQSMVEMMISFLTVDETHPSFPSHLLLKRILDGGMNSKLYSRLCVKQGLIYDIEVRIDSYVGLGILDIITTSSPEKMPIILQEIGAILKELCETDISENELTIQKACFAHEIMYATDNVSFLSTWYTSQFLFSHITTLQERINAVQKVSPSQLNALARQIFHRNNAYLVTVGPSSAYQKRLRRFFSKNFLT